MNVKDNDLEYIVPSGSASVKEMRMIVKSRDVFLCHAGVDKEAFVLPFAAELRRHAISYWLDEAEIHWGESIPGKVNDGLAEARFVVVFITEAFVNRPFPTAELMSSLNVELTAGKTRVLLIVAIARSEFLRHYPLLADKLYLEWESGTKRMALALLQTLGRRYQSEWTWIYPQDHLGQVWFRVAPNPEFQNEKHRCSISWGPWNYELSLNLREGAVNMVHGKSHSGDPTPIRMHIEPPAYCDFGVAYPHEGTTIDINRGWHYSEPHLS